MTEEQKQLLEQCFIAELLWDKCYFSEDGQIYKPDLDESGNIISTGEDVYKKVQVSRNIKLEPSTQEILNAQLLKTNAEIQLELEKQKQLNSQILLQLAQGGSTNV